jgi:LacI family transcriptional regulator
LTQTLTIGALKTIWEVGLDLPRDLSLLAYDDSEWFTALRPMLTTIRQPVEAFADQAWSMLMARLNNDRSPKLRAEVHCSLVIRESTARNEAGKVMPNPQPEITARGAALARAGLTESPVHRREVF